MTERQRTKFWRSTATRMSKQQKGIDRERQLERPGDHWRSYASPPRESRKGEASGRKGKHRWRDNTTHRAELCSPPSLQLIPGPSVRRECITSESMHINTLLLHNRKIPLQEIEFVYIFVQFTHFCMFIPLYIHGVSKRCKIPNCGMNNRYILSSYTQGH